MDNKEISDSEKLDYIYNVAKMIMETLSKKEEKDPETSPWDDDYVKVVV